MNEHEFELTEEGKREVQSFITECKTKRNEVLDNAGDTIKHTTIPTQKEILNDLNSQEDVDECGYDACWGVTDNYGIRLKQRINLKMCYLCGLQIWILNHQRKLKML